MRTSPSPSALSSLCVLVLSLAASAAFAKPKIELAITQAKEVVEVKGATRTVKMVPVKEATPGDVLEYTLAFTNSGDEPAKDAVIDDPIPKGASFLPGTATSEGAEVLFSADGGKTFASTTKVTYETRLATGQTDKRVASPGDYTHIRWIVKTIPPGATGKVAFRVRVN